MCADNRNALDTAHGFRGIAPGVGVEASLARTQALTRRKLKRRYDSEAQGG